MDQQHDEEQSAGYPIGRGYGNDYMRGGEVFGGYGYSKRGAYEATRGEHPDTNEPAGDALTLDTAATDLSSLPAPDAHDPARASSIEEQLSHLEHTFGSSGGSLRHSRSYYVTQAQLQQRVYRTPRERTPTATHSAPITCDRLDTS